MTKGKKIALGAVAGLLTISSAIGASAAQSTQTFIGVDAAKKNALAHAGIEQKNAIFVKAKLDRNGNSYEYDVEFYSANKEYDYEIDAVTGRVLEADYDIEYYAIPGSKTATTQTNVAGDFIGVAKAKTIALENAGLKEADVRFVTAKLDYDDGRTIYDLEFYSGNREYDYEIDARSGQIYESSQDLENGYFVENNTDVAAANSSTTPIKKQQAQSIALANAGLTESEVRFVTTKLDYDDGRNTYDVKFYDGNLEYEYEIDAYTGKILEMDVDRD